MSEQLTANVFMGWAKDPAQNHLLLDAVTSGTLEPALLTYAAEYLGGIADKRAAFAALVPIAQTAEYSFVREGAIYGLAHTELPEAFDVLRDIAINDKDQDVRDIANDILTPHVPG